MSALAGSSNQSRERRRRGEREVVESVMYVRDRKAQDHRVHVLLSGIEPRRREIRSVRRVGKDLRLQAQAVTLAIDAVRLADARAIEKIPRVELQPWRRREQLHDTTGERILEARRRPQRPRATVQHEIVIVAPTETQLLITPVVNELADDTRLPKVEGGPCDFAALAGRNQRRIDRRVRVGMQREPMARECRCDRLHRRD